MTPAASPVTVDDRALPDRVWTWRKRPPGALRSTSIWLAPPLSFQDRAMALADSALAVRRLGAAGGLPPPPVPFPVP